MTSIENPKKLRAQPGKAVLPNKAGEHDNIEEKEKQKNIGSTGFPACAQKDGLLITRRNLPHWQFTGSFYFVSFRLKSGNLSEEERIMVLDAIKHFHNIRYLVIVSVVMQDHVHLLLKPSISESKVDFPLSKILQSIKGFSALQINKSRNTKGALWQEESYDRIVRDYDEYLDKWNYIRSNPVKAELCHSPEDYAFLWEPGEPET
ncbi:MAG: transposase [Deltaproteobacteria bacterium]|nr:transposase [Deltaproteobacteria bacterium]